MSTRFVRALTALIATAVVVGATYPLWKRVPAPGPVVLKDNTTASESLLRARAAEPHPNAPLWEPMDVADVPALYGAPDDERLADPWTGFAYRPNHARRLVLPDHPEGAFGKRTNSLGLSQPEELSPARDFLVLVGGDSHADGLCDDADTFAAQSRERLRALHPDRTIDVANAAEAGYAFHHYLGLLHKFAELRPNVYVVAIYTGNDVMGTVKLRHYFARTMPPPHTLEYFKEIRRAQKISTGAVANALNQLLYFRRYPDELEPSIQNALALCAELEDFARERGIEVLYVAIPACLEASGVGEAKLAELKRELALETVWDHFEVVTDRLVAGLRARGNDVTDLREHFSGLRERYYWTDLHINVDGQRLIAELLAPKLDLAFARAVR
ncbi:MAG: SGNH/GDSL hydrolase family protein [Planctomycetes bacterium]|nr:SGNH/GDSL hydrolase family protein [Planctomycetota bacterium]